MGASSSGDDCIVRLSNMVKRDELLDDTEYQDILEVRASVILCGANSVPEALWISSASLNMHVWDLTRSILLGIAVSCGL